MTFNPAHADLIEWKAAYVAKVRAYTAHLDYKDFIFKLFTIKSAKQKNIKTENNM